MAPDCNNGYRHNNKANMAATASISQSGTTATTYSPSTIPSIILTARGSKGDLFPIKRLFISSDLNSYHSVPNSDAKISIFFDYQHVFDKNIINFASELERQKKKMEIVSMPLWAWILFYVLVFIMLIIDLKSFGKKGQHEVSVSEALKMTVVWVAVSMVFCVGIYYLYPGDSHEKAMEFLAGYLIEKSLSMDNLFVFLMLFSFFGVERKYQHEVLFWGIFGALVLRSIFIFAGTAMIARFEWILGLFGLFLIYTGIKMFGHNDEEQVDPSKNIFVKLFKKFLPVTDKMHEDKFFILENGKHLATPLFITLLVIETTDVAFAVDSIPAVFSVSRDPFIVLTSNIFAILGLRALYFALAAVAKYFTYLKYGLGIILSFVGVKMLLSLKDIEIPTSISLAVIFGVLVLSMGLSVIISRRKA